MSNWLKKIFRLNVLAPIVGLETRGERVTRSFKESNIQLTIKLVQDSFR